MSFRPGQFVFIRRLSVASDMPKACAMAAIVVSESIARKLFSIGDDGKNRHKKNFSSGTVEKSSRWYTLADWRFAKFYDFSEIFDSSRS